jgi:hypothetical protein
MALRRRREQDEQLAKLAWCYVSVVHSRWSTLLTTDAVFAILIIFSALFQILQLLPKLVEILVAASEKCSDVW